MQKKVDLTVHTNSAGWVRHCANLAGVVQVIGAGYRIRMFSPELFVYKIEKR
jgi:hypothetical protein